VGKIQLLSFTNPEGLKSVGDNKFVPTEASGEAVFSKTTTLAQGKLESSNVDLYEQIENVMRLNAGVLSNYRVIKYSDELFRQAVNLRQ
jgi:flagellar hook protein FlgE